MRHQHHSYLFGLTILILAIGVSSIGWAQQEKDAQDAKRTTRPQWKKIDPNAKQKNPLKIAPLQGGAKRDMPVTTDLCVDVVTLRDGRELAGIVTGGDQQTSVRLLVERYWLLNQHPKMYAEVLAQEKKLLAQSHNQILGRINEWIEERKADQVLVVFLKDELERIEKEADGSMVESKRFVQMTVPGNKIRRVYLQPANRRRVGLVALKNRLINVSFKTLSELTKELAAEKLEIRDVELDVSKDVVAQPQSESQWRARQAIVEFDLREALEFQGTGQLLVKKGAQLNPQDLIQQMTAGMGVQAMGGVQGPLAANWWQRAVDFAEQEKIRGVRVSRLAQDPNNPNIGVESVFLAMKNPGDWFVVKRILTKANVNNQANQDVQNVAQDPQVVELMKLFGGMANQGQLQFALLNGAATKKALEDSDDQFNAFLDQFAQRLDTPELIVR